MSGPAPSPRRAELTALRLFYFGSFAALGAYLPLFPRWLEARGIRGLAMGAVAATLPAMSVLAPPAFGFLADALGLRVAVLRFACAGAFAAFAILAACAAWGVALGFAGIFVAVLAFSFFRAPMGPMADVVALELSSGVGTPYGRLRLWGSIGFALMASVAGVWIDPMRPAQLPAVIAVGFLVALGIALALRAPDRSPAPPRAPAPERDPTAPLALSRRLRALLSGRDFRLFLAASFLAQGAHSAYDLCFSLHLRDVGFPSTLLGVAWATGVLAEVALMAASGSLLARVRPPVLIAVAFAGASLRWALLATLRSTPALLAAQPLHAVSFATMWIASLAYTKQRAPPQILATAQGLFAASTGAGSVLGMLAWGQLYARGGGALVFGVASVLSAMACALAIPFARAVRQLSGRDTVFSVSPPERE